MLRVIVTRPQAQAASWVERLIERGIDAVALPLIDILPPADPAGVQAAWHSLASRRLVVFVSPNAVQQFFALKAIDASAWPMDTEAASIGPGTTQALKDHGVPVQNIVEPDPEAQQFDSEALWQQLTLQSWTAASVLIVRGDGGRGGREWLADQLRERGAMVDFVSAYRRAAMQFEGALAARLEDAVTRPDRHLWLFSSAEAIDHLMAIQVGTAWGGAQCVASHPRIAERARAAGFGRVHDCRPTLDAVVACLQSLEVPMVAAAAAPVQPIVPAPAAPPVHPATPEPDPSPARSGTGAPPPALPPAPAPPSPMNATPSPFRPAGLQRWTLAAVALALLVAIAGALTAWQSNQRVKLLQEELVRRQQLVQGESTEARVFAKQAQEGMRDSAAKLAVLEARVAEVAVQRTQLEELIQSVSRSRDENLLADVDASLRVAMQQSAITGSAEPLVATLKQSDERLARSAQPRLEGVRRSIARDLDRVKSASITDISSLSIKLDEAIRLIDELPLLSTLEPRHVNSAAAADSSAASAPSRASAASAPGELNAAWVKAWREGWSATSGRVWSEAKSLVRVTRIDQPEAMLLAPEQGYFLRENLKLRLLNARLALLSRQYDTAQVDLQAAQSAIDRYFDRSGKRHALASELLKQIVQQARHVGVPRPDDTLAALAAATAGR